MSRISELVNANLKDKVTSLNTIIDIGAGDGRNSESFTIFKNLRKKIAVEAHCYDKFYFSDSWTIVKDIDSALQLLKESDSVIATMWDVIEHLKKEDGFALLKRLEQVCDKIIIFTPRGFLEQSERTYPDLIESNPHMRHVSGWTEIDFKHMGYSYQILPDFHMPTGYDFQWDAILAWKGF